MSKKNVKKGSFKKPKVQYRLQSDNGITLRKPKPWELALPELEKPVKFKTPPNPQFEIKTFTEEEFIESWNDMNEDTINDTIETYCGHINEDEEKEKHEECLKEEKKGKKK